MPKPMVAKMKRLLFLSKKSNQIVPKMFCITAKVRVDRLLNRKTRMTMKLQFPLLA